MKLISLLSLLLLASCGFETVGTGARGIKTTFGEVIGEPLPEGLHFYNPLTSDIYEYSVREQKFESSTDVFTKDTQRTVVAFAVIWYPDPKYVHHIYKNIGIATDLEEKILKPVVLGTMKDVIGQIIADDLVSKRELATKNTLDMIKNNLLERNIVVSDLQFTNLDFDDAYEKSVEEKVIATQNALKAKNVTVTIEEEAKQVVLTAKADAEAMKIKSEALSRNQNLVSYEIAIRWNGVLPTTILGNTVPMLNLGNLK